MSDDNLSPELEQTLDEHLRWVNKATELASGLPSSRRRERITLCVP
jgi:hypothetical protein